VATRAELQKIGRRKTDHGKTAFFAGGGEMKESKTMVKKEVDFFKKKGAPKAMIKHEQAEMKAAKFAKGGGVESKGKTKGRMVAMRGGGKC
jgi:hypothetical protein